MRLIGADYSADVHIELGTCGMGMPVIRSNQKIRSMGMGEVLEVSSAHP
ncbi:MAG: hypothetical protein H8E26_08865 [FCB group bacterium]|nr:hypothetical protein [FCB group bacterium]MBL7028897.1 hypothetical protein [Candidatus Neomarinimicrobiota bacterium]MBL7122735.1 hypothetical protein [Candidatus Neomarinimicrobiota bacterium]